MYELTDKIIRKLNKIFISLFLGFATKADELNVLHATKTLYEKLDLSTRKALLKIAKDKKRDLDDSYIYEILMGYDPVVKYVYEHEVDRKRMRFAEAYIASKGDPKEIKKAMRLWAAMAGQYAITVADAAFIEDCKAKGIRQIAWVTENDERRCFECAKREGKIYPIDKIPPKLHIGCRCYYKPIE